MDSGFLPEANPAYPEYVTEHVTDNVVTNFQIIASKIYLFFLSASLKTCPDFQFLVSELTSAQP